jgi:hypothetical protein
VDQKAKDLFNRYWDLTITFDAICVALGMKRTDVTPMAQAYYGVKEYEALQKGLRDKKRHNQAARQRTLSKLDLTTWVHNFIRGTHLQTVEQFAAAHYLTVEDFIEKLKETHTGAISLYDLIVLKKRRIQNASHLDEKNHPPKKTPSF